MSVIANPFYVNGHDWRFYVVDSHGHIIGMSNSPEWCESLIRRLT